MAVLHKEYYKGTGNGQKNIRVNQDIRAYIENHPNGDFSHVLAEDDRWQVFYHLSDMRTSIIGTSGKKMPLFWRLAGSLEL